MGRKGIILALIIFIGLGFYVFLVEKKKPVSEGKKEIILKFDKDKARRLILSRDEKEIVLNRDKDDKWQITSPLITKADDEVVKDLVNDLSGLESSQNLEVEPSEWEDFGLKKPKFEVTVLIEGNREEKLAFGDKNPAGTSTYTRLRGKDKIYLVPIYQADSFNKEVFDLREKRLLLFDKEKVTGVELIYGGEDILLEKHGEEWQVVKPVKDKGDKYEIDGLISDIYDLKADGFIDKIEENETYGLDVPEVKAVINVGGVEKKILLGKKAVEKEGTIYASVEGDSRLFLVSDDFLSRLKKDPSELKKALEQPPEGGMGEKKEERQD